MSGPAARGPAARTSAALAALAALALGAVPALAASPSAAGPSPAAPAAARTTPPAAASAGWAGTRWGDDVTGEGRKAAADGTYRPAKDAGSLYTIMRNNGVRKVWEGRRGALAGTGVTVALVDTGIAPVEGLDAPGKVVQGPDLSFEGQAPALAYLDGYGHGTHMAGIIAGRDADAGRGDRDDPQRFAGVAPGARLLNMKVGTADGGVDATQVIAALDWVVAHRDDPAAGARVVNLSWGTASVQPAALDPLARAVENAWRHGVVVVVAAGNDGAGVPRLTMPAADPYVIAVGAADQNGTERPRDDTLASFTNGGDAARRADVLAPGRSVVSLRVPGSVADRGNPGAVVAGATGDRFFRGSGTSQAAAVVSGAVALLLEQRPGLTPDQVKWLLTSTAKAWDGQGAGPASASAGMLDVEAALRARTPSPAQAAQAYPASTGLGSLEASRGGSHVADPLTGAELSGEQDIFGAPWDAAAWAAAEDAGTAWSGDTWRTRRWSGTWTGASWSGVDWSTRRWSDTTWSTRRWSDGDWTTRRWSSEAWSTRRWSGADWGASTTW